MTSIINIYCDETCHLLNRGDQAMALGSVYCDKLYVQEISKNIRKIKKSHSIRKGQEFKWTKISPSNKDFYIDIVNYFFEEDKLKFRAVLIPDKDKLDHAFYSQTHDDWYYKMYYIMLDWIINSTQKHHIYIDIKDTLGGNRVRKLHDVLANRKLDFKHECIERVQQIRSDESDLLQVADILIGAIGYYNRFKLNGGAKVSVIQAIQKNQPSISLNKTTQYGHEKFNLLKWEAANS